MPYVHVVDDRIYVNNHDWTFKGTKWFIDVPHNVNYFEQKLYAWINIKVPLI